MLLPFLKKAGILLTLSRTFSLTMAKSKFEYVRDFEAHAKCLLNSWIVIRLDGKGFHKFSEVHDFEKPNDKRALDLMTRAAASVFSELHDVCFAFGHSDEYSFVFRKTTQMYSRRHDKLLSLVTSIFSSAYVFYWREYFGIEKLIYPPCFDGRIVLFPTDNNLRDYLSWRQADVHVNNLHNTAFWALVLKKNMTTKEISTVSPSPVLALWNNKKADERLRGTLSSDKNEILFSEFNINYNNEPEQFKKGTSLVRKSVKNPETGKLVLSVVPLCCDIIKSKFWEDNPEILECGMAAIFENVNSTPVIPIKQDKKHCV